MKNPAKKIAKGTKKTMKCLVNQERKMVRKVQHMFTTKQHDKGARENAPVSQTSSVG